VRWYKSPSRLLAAAAVAWTALGTYSELGTRYSLDLHVYRSAAAALVAGRNPYLEVFTRHHLPFTYPPFALLTFLPLSLGPDVLIEVTWWLVNAVCTVAIVYFLMTRTVRVERRLAIYRSLLIAPILCIALEPIRSNLDYGQINAMLFLATLYDFFGVRPGRRGVLVGLAAAVKLTPAIFIIYFIVSRDVRAVVRSSATFVAATALGFLVLPSQSVTYWTNEVFRPERTGPTRGPLNQSLYGLFHRWPFTPFHSALWLGAVVVFVVAGSLLARSLVQRQQFVAAAVALGLTGELVSPVSWTHHWIWIMALPILIATTPRERTATTIVKIVMVGLIVVACVAPYTWSGSGWPLRIASDSLVGLGVVLLLAWTVAEGRPTPLRS
jgi:alpha-1,2-mannosyltransferase